MIPENFKQILANEQYTGLFQTIALLLFILFFVGILFYVFSRPKRYYDEEANAPLDDDEKPFNL